MEEYPIRPLTEAELAEIKSLHKVGYTAAQVGRHIKRPTEMVLDAAPSLGLTFQPRRSCGRKPMYNHGAMRRLYQEGHSFPDIAARLGCHVDTVKTYIKRTT